MITAKELAAKLNNRQYGEEMTDDDEKLAKESGLVVVFGYSDDNAELRGAINDEFSCYNGGWFCVDKQGLVDLPDDDEQRTLKKFGVLDQIKKGRKIIALWCADDVYSWTYKTDIPHETFDIKEDDGFYCRGVVFSLKDL